MAPRKNKSARKRRRQQQQSNITLPSAFPGLESLISEISFLANNFEDTLELPANLDKFVVDKSSVNDEFYILGDGSFGLVTLGTLHKSNKTVTKVAIKAASNVTYNKMTMEEASVMANFDHVNVIKLLAVQKEPFKIVMEYMAHGDLIDALEKNIFSGQADMMNILNQVASGMEYLAQNNYVHRDLACRNVFVNLKKQCKVGDFGLCKYVGDSNGIFEIKPNQFYNHYCAPEVLDTKRFTTKSDVWSMGLLIWELYFTVSNIPIFYKRILLDIFACSRELPKPKLCPIYLYFYIKNVLLNENARKRPDFSHLKEDLSLMKNN